MLGSVAFQAGMSIGPGFSIVSLVRPDLLGDSQDVGIEEGRHTELPSLNMRAEWNRTKVCWALCGSQMSWVLNLGSYLCHC